MIRDASATDYERARTVLDAAYGEYSTAFPPENWEPYRADILDLEGRGKESQLIVMEANGQIVGCVSYYPPGAEASYPIKLAGRSWPEAWAGIRLLAVDPEARGKKVGRALTEACIERARSEGASGLGLHTTSAMSVARAMYERMGFERLPAFDFEAGPVTVEAYGLSLDPSR